MKFPMDHKIKRPFVYVSAAATKIEKTFSKVRASQKKVEELKALFPQKVTQLKRESK